MAENEKNWIAFFICLIAIRPNGKSKLPNFQLPNLAFQSIWYIIIDLFVVQWHNQNQPFMSWPSAPRWFSPTWLKLHVGSMSMTPLPKRRLHIMLIGPATISLHCSASMQSPYRLSWTRFAVFAKWWFASFRFNVNKSTNTGKVFMMGAKRWNVVRLLRWNLSPWKPWFKCHCASYRTWRTPFHHSFSHSSREFTASFAHCINACCCSNNSRSRTVAHSNATKATAAASASAIASA